MITFRKRRGQAFETMMLVISVIVAIAILGVLTGILGGLGTIGTDWRGTVSQGIKEVGTYGISSAKTITVKKGDSLDAKQATQNIQSFIPADVEFILSDQITSGQEFEVSGSDDNQRIRFLKGSSQDYSLVVAADGEKDGKKVFVCLSRTTEKKETSAATICTERLDQA